MSISVYRMSFRERLLLAANFAGVEPGPASIAKSLGMKNRQTVHRWLSDGIVPEQDMIFHIAESWKINAAWLGTGAGEMLPSPPPDLSPPERELLQIFRRLSKDRRSSLQAIVRAFAKAAVLVCFFVSSAGYNTQAEAGLKSLQPAYYVKLLLRMILIIIRRSSTRLPLCPNLTHA